MCIGRPAAPTPPPAAPAPPPMAKAVPMEAPVKATQQVQQGEVDAGKLKKKRSKRSQQQQASKGASALKIALNTGTKASGSKSSGLNIPK